MDSKYVKTLTFNEHYCPDVIVAANKIAKSQNRKVHDAIRLLIIKEASKIKSK